MWDFLVRNYIVISHPSCGTHIHVSLAEGYTPGKVKRITQAVLHFEPAFEALLPIDRRQNEYARSNWIDNPCFGRNNMSRRDSIAMIERCATIEDVVNLMCPAQTKYYGWKFLNIIIDPTRTIEFRRAPCSSTAEDVFIWAELAISFVQAAVKFGTSENLSKVPNTLEGLQRFLLNAGIVDSPGIKRFTIYPCALQRPRANRFSGT